MPPSIGYCRPQEGHVRPPASIVPSGRAAAVVSASGKAWSTGQLRKVSSSEVIPSHAVHRDAGDFSLDARERVIDRFRFTAQLVGYLTVRLAELIAGEHAPFEFA